MVDFEYNATRRYSRASLARFFDESRKIPGIEWRMELGIDYYQMKAVAKAANIAAAKRAAQLLRISDRKIVRDIIKQQEFDIGDIGDHLSDSFEVDVPPSVSGTALAQFRFDKAYAVVNGKASGLDKGLEVTRDRTVYVVTFLPDRGDEDAVRKDGTLAERLERLQTVFKSLGKPEKATTTF